MRILVTIPHFYRYSQKSSYGSESADTVSRAAMVEKTIAGLHQNCGDRQRFAKRNGTDRVLYRANRSLHADVHVVVCTTGSDHLLQFLKKTPFAFENVSTNAEPKVLGYECHRVLAEALGKYDYYCYLEDDLQILDAQFFAKLRWFSIEFGETRLLQANRCYINRNGWKQYVEEFNPIAGSRILEREIMATKLRFYNPLNPHSGCFFLTENQMRNWREKSYFLNRSDAFVGPLESAATLGIARTFAIYKPFEQNAAFLEILDNGVALRPQSKDIYDLG